MNLKTLLQNTTFTTGAAWVYVDNQSESAGIRFTEGSNVRATASGLTNIMSGTPRTFQIDMPKTGSRYAESREINNWKFGPSGYEVALQTSSSDPTPLGTITIRGNKMYTITVTGDHNADGIKAWISDETDIPTEDLAGTW